MGLSAVVSCLNGNNNQASSPTQLKCPVSVVNQLKPAELRVHKLSGHGRDCKHVKEMEYKTEIE